MLTSERILIGVTSDSLLKAKAYALYIEPFEERRKRVIDFLHRLNPLIEIDIFELADPVG